MVEITADELAIATVEELDDARDDDTAEELAIVTAEELDETVEEETADEDGRGLEATAVLEAAAEEDGNEEEEEEKDEDETVEAVDDGITTLELLEVDETVIAEE